MLNRIDRSSFAPQFKPQSEVDRVAEILGNLLTREQIQDGIELPKHQYGRKELPLTGVADQLDLTVFQVLGNVEPIIQLFELDEALKMVGGKKHFLEVIQLVDPSLASKISLYQLQRIDLEGKELLDPLLLPLNQIYRMTLETFEYIPDASKPLYLARMELEEKNGGPKGEFHPKSVGGVRQMKEENLPLLPGYAIKALSKKQLETINLAKFPKRTLSDILSLKFSPLTKQQKALAIATLYSENLQEEKN